jgi:Toluene-4-monooxygenase system protein B (TmoB)
MDAAAEGRMIPLYGFLEGDSIGLLVLAEESDTAAELADKLQSAARIRVPSVAKVKVVYQGAIVAANTTVAQAQMGALDRFDVIRADGR